MQVGFSPEGGAQQLILNLIDAAQKEICVAAYGYSSPEVTEHLLAARGRNVKIRLVIDHRNFVSDSQESHRCLKALIDSGAQVRTNSRYRIHHDKYLIVDSKHLQTGSFNYTQSAARRNSENILIRWQDPALAARYLKHWSDRWLSGKPLLGAHCVKAK